MRIAGPKEGYPNGYVRFYNRFGQPLNVLETPGPESETHIPIAPNGSYQVLEGW